MKRSLIILLALLGLVAAACGDDSSSSSDDGAASDTTASPTTDRYGSSTDTTDTTVAATDTTATGEASVAVAEVGDLGEALVDGDGLTLYLFEQDDGTTSACTGGCADVWPALVGGAAAGEGVDASLLGTADGQAADQVTYNGHLLYTFSGDEAPGDANGLGIPDWYPVDADGNAIDAD